jgi:hypothetical protein
MDKTDTQEIQGSFGYFCLLCQKSKVRVRSNALPYVWQHFSQRPPGTFLSRSSSFSSARHVLAKRPLRRFPVTVSCSSTSTMAELSERHGTADVFVSPSARIPAGRTDRRKQPGSLNRRGSSGRPPFRRMSPLALQPLILLSGKISAPSVNTSEKATDGTK